MFYHHDHITRVVLKTWLILALEIYHTLQTSEIIMHEGLARIVGLDDDDSNTVDVPPHHDHGHEKQHI